MRVLRVYVCDCVYKRVCTCECVAGVCASVRVIVCTGMCVSTCEYLGVVLSVWGCV